MNKKELIEKIEALPDSAGLIRPKIDKKLVLGLVRKLDEPEKVKVPQFVAEYIKYARSHDWDLQDAMDSNFIASEEDGNFSDWFYTDDNMELFAQAWLDGYEEVEEEKRYYIRLKIDDENYNYLNYIKHLSAWCLAGIKKDKKFRTEHTRKQLEDAGFGEVFNSTLFEVEEVEE